MSENPYQTPATISTEMPTGLVRVAKSFSYDNFPGAEGVTFTGTVMAGADGLYLSHDKHAWQSAATWVAIFGLLGFAIHKMMMRNKKFEYPYPVLPADDLPDQIRQSMDGHKFTGKSMVSVIPKEQIASFTSGMLAKSFALQDGVVLQIASSIGKGMKQLPALGYEKT